jgi:hypothetical protein
MLLKDKTFLMEFIMKIEYLQLKNHKVEIQKLGTLEPSSFSSRIS